ncbi:MAG: hypothetical protein GY748_06365, partial [Planctomycetaceae bacterium]|nr:hypothetical protein [Planctomycetaceae bacterium]
MSNDVSGGSTSPNSTDSNSVSPKTTEVQVVSQEENNSEQAPVPVEFVVEGQSDVVEGQSETENVVDESVEVVVQKGLFVDSLSIDPAEEVAILLGEKPKKKPAIEVEAVAPVEVVEVPVTEADSKDDDPFLATEDLD